MCGATYLAPWLNGVLGWQGLGTTALEKLRAGSNPLGNFNQPPGFNRVHIFIGLPSLYVCRRPNQSKCKMHDTSVVVCTFRPFQG